MNRSTYLAGDSGAQEAQILVNWYQTKSDFWQVHIVDKRARLQATPNNMQHHLGPLTQQSAKSSR